MLTHKDALSQALEQIERDPSELPVSISTRWFKVYSRRPFDDHDDYVNVITWADGSTEERNRIPHEWNCIAIATHLRLYEANRASLDVTLNTMPEIA